MQEYARQRRLTRWMIPVPLLTPFLSSLWLGLVTPLYARVGRKLVESLRNPTLVSNNLAETVFSVRPRSVREAIGRALVNEGTILGGRPIRFADRRFSNNHGDGFARTSLPTDPTNRRKNGLVLRELALVCAWFYRFVDWGSRHPPWPP